MTTENNNENQGCPDCGAKFAPCPKCGCAVRIEQVDIYHTGSCSCGGVVDEECPVRFACSFNEERRSVEEMELRDEMLMGVVTNNESSAEVLVEVAVLDANQVFQSTKKIPAAEVTDKHFLLPDGCDLPAGQYRLDWDKGCFLPIHDPKAIKASEPVALNAMAWLMLALDASGVQLPTPSLEWLDFYVNTVDFVGSKRTQAEAAMLHAYAEKRGL